MDVCTYERSRRAGHGATGDRSQRDRHWIAASTRVGDDYGHAIVDDHSGLAYVELHQDEKAATVTGFVERALVFFAAHGITARRLMTDNASPTVKNRSLDDELLAAERLRHRRPRPAAYAADAPTARSNRLPRDRWAANGGTAEATPSSAHRASLLGDWLEHYNTPATAL